jgi:hypothetical protein
MTKAAEKKRAMVRHVYDVHFVLKVELPVREARPEDLEIEEAVTALVDEEIALRSQAPALATVELPLCDASEFTVNFVETEGLSVAPAAMPKKRRAS